MSRVIFRNRGVSAYMGVSLLSLTALILIIFASKIKDPKTESLFRLNRIRKLEMVDRNEGIMSENGNKYGETDKEPGFLSWEQSDPRLMEYIRKNHLTPPSTLPYNLVSLGDHLNAYSTFVLDYFNNSKIGTFIEAGAYDGEDSSNTLYLESLGWKGILIECNPLTYPKLRAKNRKAWVANVCLSTTDKPQPVKIFSASKAPQNAQIDRQLTFEEMKAAGIAKAEKVWDEYSVMSFPFYSIIEAVAEFEEIDFLSLDVQGVEIKVLKTFPFEKIPIKLIFAEVNMYNETEKVEFKTLMASKGYRFLHQTDNALDYVFGLT